MAKIYVSSTFEDLEECRRHVALALRSLEHVDVAMENYVARDPQIVERCLADVASSDLYVGIFAWRYGWIPRGHDQAITELEYRHAVKHGKDCLIFLHDEEAPWAPKFKDEGEELARLKELRNELQEAHSPVYFRTPDDLATRVTAAVAVWDRGARPTSRPEGAPAGASPIDPVLPEQLLDLARRMERGLRSARFSFDAIVELAGRLERRAGLPTAHETWSAEEQLAVGSRNAASMAVVALELAAELDEAQALLHDVEPATGEFAAEIREEGLDPMTVGDVVELLNAVHRRLHRAADLLDQLLGDLRRRRTNVWVPISEDLEAVGARLDACQRQVVTWWHELGLTPPFPAPRGTRPVR